MDITIFIYIYVYINVYALTYTGIDYRYVAHFVTAITPILIQRLDNPCRQQGSCKRMIHNSVNVTEAPRIIMSFMGSGTVKDGFKPGGAGSFGLDFRAGKGCLPGRAIRP